MSTNEVKMDDTVTSVLIGKDFFSFPILLEEDYINSI